jgi:GTP cyclohydrolase I
MVPASPLRALPDIANDPRADASTGALDWVGMGAIQAPVNLVGDDGAPVRCNAKVTAFVDLVQPQARGIHMSRLYLHVDKVLSGETLTPAALRRLLKDFLESHSGLSSRAMVRIEFDYLLRRPALRSDNSGWKSYPVTITGLVEAGHFQLELGCSVLYSSTCPASAALARQLIQEQFQADFVPGEPLDHARVLSWLGTEQGICATPHSQRSAADVKVKLKPVFDEFPIIALIDAIEQSLQTPVQTAVKREDEQAFARLNGANLMFCEDAARRVRVALDGDERVADFHVRASHFESLHPHDAVAVATKGIPGGYRAGTEA